MGVISATGVKERFAELLEVPKKDADDILWAFQEICTDAVKNGDTITLPGVGKLSCQVRAARTARNPRTGDPVKVPAKVVLKFSIAKPLKDSAPSLKSKQGKALLEEAEEKQAQREKAKRKREREAKASGSKGKGKKGSKVKKSSSSVKKKHKAASRY